MPSRLLLALLQRCRGADGGAPSAPQPCFAGYVSCPSRFSLRLQGEAGSVRQAVSVTEILYYVVDCRGDDQPDAGET